METAHDYRCLFHRCLSENKFPNSAEESPSVRLKWNSPFNARCGMFCVIFTTCMIPLDRVNKTLNLCTILKPFFKSRKFRNSSFNKEENCSLGASRFTVLYFTAVALINKEVLEMFVSFRGMSGI